MATNPMLPPQAPPVKVDPLTGKLVPASMPPPSPTLGFQTWASAPENTLKIQPSMVAQGAPLQPNAGMASANPPPLAPMASSTPPAMAYDKTGVLGGQAIPELQQRGNIDYNPRPEITNADGSRSSIYSMTVPIGKSGASLPWESPDVSGYALVPSIADGKFLSPNGKMPTTEAGNQQLEDAATAYYNKTRQHLGVFNSAGAADEYAGLTHDYGNRGSLGQAGAPEQVFMPSPSIRSIVNNTQRNINAAPGAAVTSPVNLPPNPMAPPTMRSATPPVRSQTGADQAELQRLQQSGAGVNQVKNPFLRTLGQIGDIAAPFLIGGGAAAIPGTTLHNAWLQDRQQGRVANDQAAQAADLAQQTGLAGLAKTQAETANLLNPPDKFQATDYGAFDPSTGTTKPILNQSGQPVSKPEEPHYVTMPDNTVVALQRAPDGTIKSTEAYKGTPGKKLSVQDLQVDGMPHKVVVDENTGSVVKDLGESGIKPPTVNVNAGLTEVDRLGSRLAKTYDTSLTNANSQLEKIADARAMINGNAEAQALGIPKVLTALVSGQGTGIRITQPELNAIGHARGIGGDVEGTLNKWAGKGSLTAPQQAQLTQILDDVKARILQKQQIANETLDSINGATKREDVVAADKSGRQRLMDLERGGNPGAIKVTAPDGSEHTFKDQATADKFKQLVGIK